MPAQNQNNSEQKIDYNPNAALEFFKLFGSSETVNAGEIIFAPSQKSFFSFLKSERMYLLIEGSVEIKSVDGKVEVIKRGRLFGEYTPIASCSFTATATTACKLMVVNEKQFQTGLKIHPDFALMLMGLFASSLRKLTSVETKKDAETSEPKNPQHKSDTVLSSKILKELVQKLGDDAIKPVLPQHVIFKEGGSAMLMYVILKGTVSARVDNKIVNTSGPGDVIGEIALVDQKPRTATVIAETHSSLLGINRQTFLELIQSMPDFGIALLKVLASRSSLHSSEPKADDDWDWD
jgi:CRP-like cAMP-binding protein